MARIEEQYEGADVIHTHMCRICGIVQPREVVTVRECKLMKLILILIAFVTGAVVGMVIAWPPKSLPQIYKEFKTIQMYEDGSYRATTQTGRMVTGCIEGAICND